MKITHLEIKKVPPSWSGFSSTPTLVFLALANPFCMGVTSRIGDSFDLVVLLRRFQYRAVNDNVRLRKAA